MHSLLEVYLTEVTNHLGPLPRARREDELKEIRQHLLNAVLSNQEAGQSEDEATANAITQFGMAKALGENIVWAWRRERRQNMRSFWGAAVCVTVMGFLLGRLAAPWISPTMRALRGSGTYDAYPWLTSTTAVLLVTTIPCILSGWISGLTFPRRAVTGVKFAMVMWYATVACRLIVRYIYQPASHPMLAATIVLAVFFAVVQGTAIVLFARLGSRQHLRRQSVARG